jgi:sec-independent protein translocase protein TatA
MGRFGATELLLLLAIGMLFFGGRKLGDIGRGLGDAIRNLKQGLRDEPEAPPPAELPKPAKPAPVRAAKKAAS